MKRDSLVKCAKDGKSVGLIAHVQAPYVMGADLVLQDLLLLILSVGLTL